MSLLGDGLDAFVKWAVSWLPTKPKPLEPKPPLTDHDVGWDEEPVTPTSNGSKGKPP